jgi:hypothetical protein
MISILTSGREATVRSSLILIAVAALAACDSQRPLEPTAVNVPTTVQAAVIPNGLGSLAWTTVALEENQKKVVGGAKFTVTGPRMSGTIVDNGQGDADPTWGKLRLYNLMPGKFTLCEIVAPIGYATLPPVCRQLDVTANAVAQVEFPHVILPHTQFQVRNLADKLVGGATFMIKDTKSTIMVVTDNGTNEIDTTLGEFTVRLPAAGSYSVCPATAPAGYYFADMTCREHFYQNGGYSNIGAFKVVPLQP